MWQNRFKWHYIYFLSLLYLYVLVRSNFSDIRFRCDLKIPYEFLIVHGAEGRVYRKVKKSSVCKRERENGGRESIKTRNKMRARGLSGRDKVRLNEERDSNWNSWLTFAHDHSSSSLSQQKKLRVTRNRKSIRRAAMAFNHAEISMFKRFTCCARGSIALFFADSFSFAFLLRPAH